MNSRPRRRAAGERAWGVEASRAGTTLQRCLALASSWRVSRQPGARLAELAAPLLADEGPLPHFHQVIQEGRPGEERRYSKDAYSVTVGIVCERCNNGWMSDLEARAKPYLESMLRGHGRALHQAGLRTTAPHATSGGRRFSSARPSSRSLGQPSCRCSTGARHAFKFGAEVRLNRDSTYFGVSPNGEYDFGGGTAYANEAIPSASGTHNIDPGDPLPDTLSSFLAGSPFAYAISIGPPYSRTARTSVRPPSIATT